MEWNGMGGGEGAYFRPFVVIFDHVAWTIIAHDFGFSWLRSMNFPISLLMCINLLYSTGNPITLKA
jgi:hypothetical protein